MTFKKLFFYLQNPKDFAFRLLARSAKWFRDDKKYINLKWWVVNFYGHEKIDWDNPTTFNEKLNWLKIYNRKPVYTQMADKSQAKKIVADKVGPQYVAKLYGVYKSFDDIDFEKLPQQFVLKCTHDSGSMIICKDKAKLDKAKAKEKLEKALKKEYFYISREWPYKNIKPQILAEEFLNDHTGNELRDYKFWCFNGVPRVVYFTNKADNIYENFYDLDFRPLDISHGFTRHKPEFTKPDTLEEMASLAAKLSEGIPFVRVDFFNVDGKVYFAEFTFFDWGGFMPFTKKQWDVKLGEWISLPKMENSGE